MLDIMYEIPKDDNIGRVTITGDYIRGTGGPLIDIRSNGLWTQNFPPVPCGFYISICAVLLICSCRILSEDYMSILLDYVPEEANQEDEAFCYQQVDGTLGIYYLDRSAVLPLSPVNYLYRYLPQLFCLGAFPAAGSRTVRAEPLEGPRVPAQQPPV